MSDETSSGSDWWKWLMHDTLGFNYIGPGTPISDPVYVAQYPPVSNADAVAKTHDEEYADIASLYHSGVIDHTEALEQIRMSDERFLKKMRANNVFGLSDFGTTASILGMQGKKYLVDVGLMSQDAYNRLDAEKASEARSVFKSMGIGVGPAQMESKEEDDQYGRGSGNEYSTPKRLKPDPRQFRALKRRPGKGSVPPLERIDRAIRGRALDYGGAAGVDVEMEIPGNEGVFIPTVQYSRRLRSQAFYGRRLNRFRRSRPIQKYFRRFKTSRRRRNVWL